MDDVFDHTGTFGYFFLDIPETFDGRSAGLNKVVDSETAKVFALMSLLNNLVKLQNLAF